jgi:uncharacterized protein (TIGR03032 family)
MSVSAREEDLESLWEGHARRWRSPSQAIASWAAPEPDPGVLRARAEGAFWDTLDAAGVTLLVTREYEHLVVALSVVGGRPRMTHLSLPHPSGLAVAPDRRSLVVASTRNPNQIFTLRPVAESLARGDVRPPDLEHRPLVPVGSTIHPGALYLHDLAYIGGELHGNSVGQNAVVALPPEGGHRVVWWPRTIERAGRPDLSLNYVQLNSIAAGGDLASSYFSASSERPSRHRPGHLNFPVDRRGVVFSGRTREPVARGLTRPHSARLRDREVWVDDSGYGELVVLRDARPETVARLPGWTRGLCFVGDVAFVGTSRVIPRFRHYAPGLDPTDSRCCVHAVDARSGRLLGSLRWPRGNQIFAIDWLPRDVSHGLPYAGTGRVESERVRQLFYSFAHPE